MRMVRMVPTKMVPGKLFLMDGFQEGDPCPGQSKVNRQMVNRSPDPIIIIIIRRRRRRQKTGSGKLFFKKEIIYLSLRFLYDFFRHAYAMTAMFRVIGRPHTPMRN
jgi:hypothetical protein